VLKPKGDFIGYRRGTNPIMDNRMTLREGVQAIGIQRLGRTSAALQYALLQSVPSSPGEPPVIRVFPACPKEWNASFTLATRGGFLVTSSRRNGVTEFVELTSRVGGSCRMRNPWKDKKVVLHRSGEETPTLAGALLQFDTKKGETLLLVPDGTKVSSLKRQVPDERQARQ
jgi:hypothetical protein